MNADQIIEEIKLLPPEQKGVVIQFVSGLNEESKPIRYADDAAVKKAAAEVMRENPELLRKLAQ